jgi:hypothetical protein
VKFERWKGVRKLINGKSLYMCHVVELMNQKSPVYALVFYLFDTKLLGSAV